MPLYEYECEACGHKFELIRKFSDPPLTACPKCEGAVKKLVSSPAFQFKGSGFYATDYARKGDSGKSEKSEKTEKKGESGPTASPESSKDASSSSAASPKDSTATATSKGTDSSTPAKTS